MEQELKQKAATEHQESEGELGSSWSNLFGREDDAEATKSGTVAEDHNSENELTARSDGKLL